jgi:hypothetical protein
MPEYIIKLATSSALALSLFVAPASALEFPSWDNDGDGAIGEEEFSTGFGDNGAFGSWDGDGNGGLDETEFNSGFGDRDVGTFSEWDESGDGLVDDREFSSGIYGHYDDDGSGAIEEPEFGDVGDDLGDGGLFDI